MIAENLIQVQHTCPDRNWPSSIFLLLDLAVKNVHDTAGVDTELCDILA